jgi:hypothetical protein
MWLMNFLPNWIFHAILLAGVLGLVASFVLKFIPFISTYTLPIQVGSILLLVLGVWFEGAMSNQAEWEARVAAMQVKVAEAEAKSAEANVQIVTKIVKKTKRIHEKGDAIITYIDREVVKNNEVIKFVENCPIPDIIIKTHNAAALNQPIEAKK